MCEKQQGASVVFGTDGGSFNFLNIGRLSAPIPVLDDTHLGVTGYREKCPGELQDAQPVTITMQNDGDADLPTVGLVQTITINSALGDWSTAEKWVGTGFVTDIRTPEYGSDTEAIQTIEVDFIFDGKTGPARTAAT